jgi:hypothetical protein
MNRHFTWRYEDNPHLKSGGQYFIMPSTVFSIGFVSSETIEVKRTPANDHRVALLVRALSELVQSNLEDQ